MSRRVKVYDGHDKFKTALTDLVAVSINFYDTEKTRGPLTNLVESLHKAGVLSDKEAMEFRLFLIE